MYVKHDDKPRKSINQLVFETWGLDHLPGYAATDPSMVNPGCNQWGIFSVPAFP